MKAKTVGSGRAVRFREALLAWAAKAGRHYLWREDSRSPYEVLVAEVLLKRTTAAAAANVYDALLRRIPTLEHLAETPEEYITAALSGLGLQRQRARALRALAAHLLANEGGTVPADLERLARAPAVGQYTARAVLSFAYGEPYGVLDSNVVRILQRVFQKALPDRPSAAVMQTLADRLVPEEDPRRYNWALLDLGTLVCRYVAPRCHDCPLAGMCDFAKAPSGRKQAQPQTPVRVRELRQKAGMSLAALAKKSGVSKFTIVNIEARRTVPRPKTLQRMAQALGVEAQMLSTGATGVK